MPIYEYRCHDCETKFEAMRSMSQADKPIECDCCHSRHTQRLLSIFSAHTDSGAGTHSSGGCASCSGGSCASCHH